ncbi:YfiT family bacillithiol transferase [Segetibacter koreensis]|uniref:YfiT family bacillithiol transferase n=1 Tax=Segetibacter koreensis TaxID=398037 RepID=UPI0003650218|nr:putative metal-dependent hydrolase [Segetibacter koreensis]
MSEANDNVRYPIGKFEPQPFSGNLKEKWLTDIKFLPTDLEFAIQNLDEHQLDTPYREGGWTVKQLTHHIADSHMNAYIRFKLALTEDNPTIKTYEEKEWANCTDVFSVPVNVSTTLLHALHRRWYAAIENITEQKFFDRTVYHPGQQKQLSLWDLLGMYAWHGRHHVAHITRLKEQEGW